MSYMEKDKEKYPDGQLPIGDKVYVFKYKSIYKNDNWWKVVALVNQQGGDRVVTLMWMVDEKKGGRWKQVQKSSAKSEDEWDKIDALHREYLPQLGKTPVNR